MGVASDERKKVVRLEENHGSPTGGEAYDVTDVVDGAYSTADFSYWVVVSMVQTRKLNEGKRKSSVLQQQWCIN